MSLRQVQVLAGGLQVGMAEQDLNGTQVCAGLEQMGREAVAQGLLILLMNCTRPGFAIGVIRSMAQKLK
jgi:hypothetical protein